jgi:hypothetical protein
MKITNVIRAHDAAYEPILKVEVEVSLEIFQDFRISLAMQNVKWSQQEIDEEVGKIWGMEFLSQLREKLV